MYMFFFSLLSLSLSPSSLFVFLLPLCLSFVFPYMKTLLPFLTPTASPTGTASHTIHVTPSSTNNDTPYRHLILFGYQGVQISNSR
ncbi:hypothetical protein QJS04_geneDACA014778 [Acorus gramineus]|uniref:Secreted protein n=1 Tax=Acorus gramineus TaxID=55184 RepID=A0AAV9BLT1_ACOGR|nr:hypothetical protein QJS04_geneDACA014778 [Acorus gramineus]